MPYRKYRRYSRRRYSRRPPRNIFYKRGANKAFRLAKYAVRMLNVERKYIDLSGNVALSTTPTITLLNGLSEGNTSTTRNGAQVKFVQHYFKLNSSLHASATVSLIRVFLLWDKQPNGALPTYEQIVEGGTATQDKLLSPLERDFSRRFVMVWQRTYPVSTDRPMRFLKVFKRFNTKVRYDDGNAGDITDISTNSYLLVMVSNEPTNTPSITYWSRMRFIDN